MGIAENLVGYELPAKNMDGTWNVVEKVELHPESRGGHSSIGYKVRNSNGREAFLKAADMDVATTGDDLLARMTALVETQKFERAILDHCHGNNMDKIVTPLDYGEKVIEYENVKEPLFWIIFELAECDARIQVNRFNRFDICWSLTALHNLATAVSQLHTAEVSHNDIKPSNVLVFGDILQKLGDLGSAVSPRIPGLHYEQICVGDPRYAAPEVLYCSDVDPEYHNLNFSRRRASDLYLLGSVGFFFMTGAMMTPTILSHMMQQHLPPDDGAGWQGTFEGALPYLRHGLTSALRDLDAELPRNEAGEITNLGQSYRTAITQLCEPDPIKRGHPLERTGTQDVYSVRRYIALFNKLRTRALN